MLVCVRVYLRTCVPVQISSRNHSHSDYTLAEPKCCRFSPSEFMGKCLLRRLHYRTIARCNSHSKTESSTKTKATRRKREEEIAVSTGQKWKMAKPI